MTPCSICLSLIYFTHRNIFYFHPCGCRIPFFFKAKYYSIFLENITFSLSIYCFCCSVAQSGFPVLHYQWTIVLISWLLWIMLNEYESALTLQDNGFLFDQHTPEVELLDHMVELFLTSWGLSVVFSMIIIPSLHSDQLWTSVSLNEMERNYFNRLHLLSISYVPGTVLFIPLKNSFI